MSRGPQVIVAGSGALGLSCALALADAGCLVTVRDPALAGPSASSVAAGMLAPVFETLLDPAGGELELLLAARDLWPALAARAGIALDRTGAVAVGSRTWLAGLAKGFSGLGLPGGEIGRAALLDLAPGLSPNFAEGLMTGEDWRLEARPALRALRAAAGAAGVVFEAAAVTGRGDADWLVVATGAAQGLADAVPELGLLTPIKGQILRFLEVRGGGMTLRGEGAYAAPASDGLAIGATMEAGVTDLRPDPIALSPLVAASARLFPALEGATFAVSAGVRAATPDGLPLAGASSDPRVLLAVGARRNGWLLAPMVAGIVTGAITGGDPGPHAARLDPARFTAG